MSFSESLIEFMKPFASESYTNPWDWISWLQKWEPQGYPEIDQPHTALEGAKLIGESCDIQPYVVVTGPVYLSKGCRIGPFTFLRGPMIIGENVQIGPHSEMARTIIMDGAEICHNSIICDSIVGTDACLSGRTSLTNVPMGRDHINTNYQGEVTPRKGKYGVLVENNVQLGVSVFAMPGTYLKAGSLVLGPCVVYGDGKIKAVC